MSLKLIIDKQDDASKSTKIVLIYLVTHWLTYQYHRFKTKFIIEVNILSHSTD